MPSSATRWIPAPVQLLVSAALGALYFYQVCLAGAEPFEDAFIIFRYANNLAAGGGLSFNHGEAPCQGFTGFTWMALLALVRLAGAETQLTAQLLGLLFSLLTIFLVYRTALGMGLAFPWLPPLLLCINAHHVHHATSGMETALFTFTVAAGAHLTLLPLKGRRGTVLTFVVLMLLALTRPEGIALALTLSAAGWWLSRDQASRRTLALVGIAVLLGYVLFSLWRYHVFGSLLSAPAMVKLFRWHRDTASRLLAGLRYTAGFFMTHPTFLLALLALVPAALARRTRLPALLMLSVWLVGIGVIIMEGGDAAHFPHWRFFAPLLPCLFLGCGVFLQWVQARLKRRNMIWPVAATVGLLSFHLPGVYTDLKFKKFHNTSPNLMAFGVLDDPLHFHEFRARGGLLQHMKRRLRPPGGLEIYVARWMQRKADTALKLASGQMGIIPYYATHDTYDLVGLTCCEVARAGAPKKRRDFLERLQPDMFLLFNIDYHLFKKDLFLVSHHLNWIFKLGDGLEGPGVGAKTYYLFSRPGVLECPAKGPLRTVYLGRNREPRTIPSDCIVEFSGSDPGH